MTFLYIYFFNFDSRCAPWTKYKKWHRRHHLRCRRCLRSHRRRHSRLRDRRRCRRRSRRHRHCHDHHHYLECIVMLSTKDGMGHP